jgi:hypothetical protein
MAFDLDEATLNELLRKALAGQPADTRAPMSQGLIAAGLGMLAGSRGKSFGEALGQGGLLGFQAMNEERTRQQKDPAQQIALANSVIGLQQNLQNMRALRDFQGEGRTPQLGPQSDFAPGEAPGPVTPPMQVPPLPQGQAATGVLPYATLQKYVNSPSAQVREMAMAQIKQFYPQFDLSLGQTRYGPGPAGAATPIASNVDPDKPQWNPATGRWENVPGKVAATGEIAGATAQAQEVAKAALDMTLQPDPNNPGGQIPMTRAQAVRAAEQRGQTPQGELPPEVLKMIDGVRKQYGYDVTVKPSAPALGRVLSEAEKTAQVAPITLNTEYEKGLQTQNLKLRETILEEDKAARANSANIDRFMQLNKDPNVAKGRFAETFSGLKNAAASFGVDVKGLPAEQAMQSISSQMALQLRNPASGGGMPGAMSDSDRNFLTAMTPSLAQSKEGRELVAETFQAVNNRKSSRLLLKHETEGGKVDSAFLKKLADYADKNPIFGADYQKRLEKVAAQGESPTDLKANLTATAKAQQAIKNGADPAAVRQRLIESGFDPKGLQ